MHHETLKFIHEQYQLAVGGSYNILDILSSLYELLENHTPTDEDSEEYDALLRNISISRDIRSKTFKLTNLVTDISFAMMYIIIWMNNVHNQNIDITIMARRKSLESELKKMLEKDQIHDRFGIRCIILNHDGEKLQHERIFELQKYFISILCKTNRKMVNDFYDWVESNPLIDLFTRERIQYVLKLPLTNIIVKDYISTPKKSGYKSLHTILAMEMFSAILPGAEIELQLRDIDMHRNAVNGPANHAQYKMSSAVNWVFKLDPENMKDLDLAGFSGYATVEDDLDGIHFSKSILNRRISNTLVQM